MNTAIRNTAVVLALTGAFVWSGPVLANGRGELRDASGRRVGTVERDGTVRDASGRRLGRVESDGTVRDASGRRLGTISGGDRRAALRFFF